MHIAHTGFPGCLSGYRFFLSQRSDRSGNLNGPALSADQTPISLWMTSSIVSDVANRFFAMTRWPGRSAFASVALGFMCLATLSPNGGMVPLDPGHPARGQAARILGRDAADSCRRPPRRAYAANSSDGKIPATLDSRGRVDLQRISGVLHDRHLPTPSLTSALVPFARPLNEPSRTFGTNRQNL